MEEEERENIFFLFHESCLFYLKISGGAGEDEKAERRSVRNFDKNSISKQQTQLWLHVSLHTDKTSSSSCVQFYGHR